MPVRYDPSIAAGMAREILARWSGARAHALRMDAPRRAAELELEDGSLLALLAPGTGYVVPVARGTLDGDAVRVTRLGGATLADARAFPDERGLLLTLAGGEGRARAGVALELRTNHWNLLSLRPEAGTEGEAPWTIAHALWTREVGGRQLRPGRPYAPPESTRRAIDEAPTLEEWRASLADVAPARARGAVLRSWAWTSTLNVDWVIGRTDEEGAPDRPRELGDEAPPVDADASFERYLEIREVAASGEETWILPRRWGAQPYPARLGEPGARRAESLLSALSKVCGDAGGPGTLLEAAADGETAVVAVDERERLRDALQKRIDGLRRKRAALERQLERTDSPHEARAVAQLLLVRKDLVKKGESEIRLEDFDGAMRRIELDPALDGVSNAERYFAEARRRERALDRIPEEISETGERLERVERGLARLDEDGPTDELWTLAGGRPDRSSRPSSREPETRLPYTSLTSSGGLEIRIGRGARDNDDLTFRHSSPEDIWLHARQVSGAHVILRWDRKDQNPPHRDLHEAAVAAAVNSGARHSGAVPVVWTRRKYVRKPRKSPPGTVAPDRVQTVFVQPDETLLDRLRRE